MTRRARPLSNPQSFNRVAFVGVCGPCGKHTYLSRKAAKTFAKRVAPGDPGTAYRCPHNAQQWHVGHLPPAIKQGAQAR